MNSTLHSPNAPSPDGPTLNGPERAPETGPGKVSTAAGAVSPSVTSTDKYHLIGIGGAGMSVVAALLHAEGHEISGSDRQESETLAELRAKGIRAYSPHDADRMPLDATVVVSSAIRDSNPELAKAKALGLPVMHRSQALALAAGDRTFVTVAGTHGKTTTSAMLACSLRGAGLDSSYAIGSTLQGMGSGAHLGSSPILVAEADESDGSFLNYQPRIEIVTNIEADHLDHYGTVQALHQGFREFADRLREGGILICCGEDAGAQDLATYARGHRNDLRVYTYGRPDHCAIAPDLPVGNVQLEAAGGQATVWFADVEANLRLPKTGIHNLLNAAAAWLAAVLIGADPAAAAQALGNFQGASRRFELRGSRAGRSAYDDYAHHPTEVRAAIAQGALTAGAGRVVVVFQPHLFSRTQIFQREFAQALAEAAEVVLAPIYPAREDPVPGVTAQLIGDALDDLGYQHWRLADSVEAAVTEAARLTGPGDLLVAVGAGDINLATPLALEVWGES